MAVARLSRRLRPTKAARSLTATEVDVLVAAERRGPIRLSDLASFAGLNPTMLSRLIPKLEEVRADSPARRRKRPPRLRVEATAKGRRLLERIRTERNDTLSKRLGSSVLSSARPYLWHSRSWRSWPSDLPGLSRGSRVGATDEPSVRDRPSYLLGVVDPNYRRYFYGQSVSLVGTWMQTVAQSWLVYTLTHSATALGFVVALQTLPVLVLGPYGGVIADRADKRRLMIVLQSLMGLPALVFGLLAVAHVVRFWELCVLAVVLGLNNTFENPARQSFVLEMVGAGDFATLSASTPRW